MASLRLSVFLTLSLSPGVLPACEPQPAPPPPRAGRAAPEPAVTTTPAPLAPPRCAGLFAFVDLATGTLVAPSPEAAAELARDATLLRALSTSHEGLVEERRPDGTVLVDLKGRFQSALLATVGPDGRVRMGHPAPPPAPPAESRSAGESERKP